MGGRRKGSSNGTSTDTKLSKKKADLSDATYTDLRPGRFQDRAGLGWWPT